MTSRRRKAFIETGRGKQGLPVDEEAEVQVAVSEAEASIAGAAPDVAVRLMYFNKNWAASTVSLARGL